MGAAHLHHFPRWLHQTQPRAGFMMPFFFTSLSFHLSLLLAGTFTGFLLTCFSLTDLLREIVPLSKYFQYIDFAVRQQLAGRTSSRLFSSSLLPPLPLFSHSAGLSAVVRHLFHHLACFLSRFFISFSLHSSILLHLFSTKELLFVCIELEFDLGLIIDKNWPQINTFISSIIYIFSLTSLTFPRARRSPWICLPLVYVTEVHNTRFSPWRGHLFGRRAARIVSGGKRRRRTRRDWERGRGGRGWGDTAETPGRSAGSRLAEGNILWERCERWEMSCWVRGHKGGRSIRRVNHSALLMVSFWLLLGGAKDRQR